MGARIRSIKPEFWTDGDVIAMSPFARLMFIGMWNFALCDYGHVADDPVRLKLQILPVDDVDPVALIQEMIDRGRVERLTTHLEGSPTQLPTQVGNGSPTQVGRSYLLVKRMADHQKIETRWNPRCFVCAGQKGSAPQQTSPNLAKPRASLVEHAQTPPTSPQERKGKVLTTRPSEPDGFDEFWSIYPRKDARPKALSAFKAALKRAPLDRILAGAKRYAAEPRERQFTAMPATWLNSDRWADEVASVHAINGANGRASGGIRTHIDPTTGAMWEG